MPQTSSSGMSHLQVATACHFLIVTFMAWSVAEEEEEAGGGDRGRFDVRTRSTV
jgi:hypothetical protein